MSGRAENVRKHFGKTVFLSSPDLVDGAHYEQWHELWRIVEVTWVVGMPFFLGYGFGIADIRVTWSDGNEADCLQKVYPIARFVAAGFAGSVFAGFVMCENLRRTFKLSDPEEAWIPESLAGQWQPTARELYKRMASDNRVRGAPCHLLFVSTHPTEQMGDAPWPKPYVWKMLSPRFDPEFAVMNKPISIGSGSEVPHYVDELRRLGDEDAIGGLFQAELGNIGGFASVVLHFLGKTVEEHPVGGISRHLHLIVVRTGFDLVLVPDDQTFYPREGQPIKVRMPPVARSWQEFREFARTRGVSAVGATC